MSLDYTCVHEFYKQLHELQPPAQPYHHYDLTQNPGTASYEMTLEGGGGAALAGAGGCDPGNMHAAAAHSSQHDPRKSKSGQFSDAYELPGGCKVLPAPSPMMLTPTSASRKRKTSSYGTSSLYDDDGEDSKSSRTLPDKKQNHSEIEKRRRDKMNTYITELSSMIPMCGAMARKLDKLTVLRMAVQHLHSVRGALQAGPLTARPRPAFLSEKELNGLILQAAHDCFLLVVGCDRGRLLYVSESVKKMLHYDKSELLGQSLFDILHPKDVAKVKEQLSSSDLSPRERLIDAKTMLPVKADVVAGASRLCPGARRSFFCRIKCKIPAEETPDPIKEESDSTAKRKKQQVEKKYCVMQCTGYLKSWGPAEMSPDGAVPEGAEEGDACTMSCLVGVGRALPDLSPAPIATPAPPVPPATRRLQYVSRHATDGKFLFVDQRVTLALGFLPQELLGTSMYEYVEAPELGAVARTHKAALLTREAMHTPPYTFRKKDGTKATVQTHFKPFRNPWTKDVECLVANNTVVTDNFTPSSVSGQDYQMYKNMDRHSLPGENTLISEPDVEMQRLIDSQVESHKIGSAIAEEALRRSSTDFSPELPADLLQDVVFNQHSSIVEVLGIDLDNFSEVRNNVPLSSAGAQNSPPPGSDPPEMTVPSVSPPLPPLGLDGNGEATMAVIMSLLEADAGLGGPVNISGLPWPLP